MINDILATDANEHFSYMRKFEEMVQKDNFNKDGKIKICFKKNYRGKRSIIINWNNYTHGRFCRKCLSI